MSETQRSERSSDCDRAERFPGRHFKHEKWRAIPARSSGASAGIPALVRSCRPGAFCWIAVLIALLCTQSCGDYQGSYALVAVNPVSVPERETPPLRGVHGLPVGSSGLYLIIGDLLVPIERGRTGCVKRSPSAAGWSGRLVIEYHTEGGEFSLSIKPPQHQQIRVTGGMTYSGSTICFWFYTFNEPRSPCKTVASVKGQKIFWPAGGVDLVFEKSRASE